jgi:hypothetical protein
MVLGMIKLTVSRLARGRGGGNNTEVILIRYTNNPSVEAEALE